MHHLEGYVNIRESLYRVTQADNLVRADLRRGDVAENSRFARIRDFLGTKPNMIKIHQEVLYTRSISDILVPSLTSSTPRTSKQSARGGPYRTLRRGSAPRRTYIATPKSVEIQVGWRWYGNRRQTTHQSVQRQNVPSSPPTPSSDLVTSYR